ncbi:hypothetical protein MMC08_002081 [Hypocenomyce scalaris]|nr:hypothetical protein [Hypocenomyce scalaris]
MAAPTDPEFPCSLTLSIPLLTHRLASTALRALQVDAELSPLVRRQFSLVCGSSNARSPQPEHINGATDGKDNGHNGQDRSGDGNGERTVLRTEYKATTNRMLRVAVNGFMESLGVVLGVMEVLDVDVLAEDVKA